MIVFGRPARSSLVKKHPLSSGICNALKYPGSTQGMSASGSGAPGAVGGCSGIVNESSPPDPAPGTIDPNAAARTPGKERTCSSIAQILDNSGAGFKDHDGISSYSLFVRLCSASGTVTDRPRPRRPS